MRELVVSGSLDGASTDFIDGRTLVDGFPGPAFVSDARGQVLFANERWMAVCGRSLDGPNGHDWRDAVDALERDRARALWTLAVTADEPRRDAFGLGSPEGGYRLYSCRTAPVRAEGRAPRVVCY